MKTRMMYLMAGLLSIMLFYENCQKKTEDEATLLSMAVCEQQLRDTYKVSYYAFVTKCSGCHNNGPTGLRGKAFADKNLAVAFENFMGLGENKVRSFALDETHQAGITGPQNATAVGAARLKWEGGFRNYQACIATVTGNSPPPPPVETISKPIARTAANARLVNLNHPTCIANRNACVVADNDFVRISFDLGTELAPASTNPVLTGATFDIELALVDNGPSADKQAYSYLVRRPRITNNSGSNLHIADFWVRLNDKTVYDGTTFSFINEIVGQGTTPVELSNMSGVVPVMVISGANGAITPGSDSIAMLFNILQKTTRPPGSGDENNPDDPGGEPPPAVTPTFTQLFGVGGPFRTACAGCHGVAGGLNITDYNSVIQRVVPGNANGSEIVMRVTNTAPAMPAGQDFFNNTNPAAVQSLRDWINAGALNN